MCQSGMLSDATAKPGSGANSPANMFEDVGNQATSESGSQFMDNVTGTLVNAGLGYATDGLVNLDTVDTLAGTKDDPSYWNMVGNSAKGYAMSSGDSGGGEGSDSGMGAGAGGSYDMGSDAYSGTGVGDSGGGFGTSGGGYDDPGAGSYSGGDTGSPQGIPSNDGNAFEANYPTNSDGTVGDNLQSGVQPSLFDKAKTLYNQYQQNSNSTNLQNAGKIYSTGKTLNNLYQAYQQKKQGQQRADYLNGQMQGLRGMYQPGTPEAMQMQQQMERSDAANGRRSQYGTRAVNLGAQLADKRAQIMNSPNYGAMNSAYLNASTNGSNAWKNAVGGAATQGAVSGLSSLFGS